MRWLLAYDIKYYAIKIKVQINSKEIISFILAYSMIIVYGIIRIKSLNIVVALRKPLPVLELTLLLASST